MPINQIKNKVNKSNANFVKRLKQTNRQVIPDWASDNIATHKLSVGTDKNGIHFIYPDVQEINGKLKDFSRPPYHYFAGQDNAIEMRDTVQVGNTNKDLNNAIKFTEEYKQYYPKFKTGGKTKHKIEAEGGEVIQSNKPFTVKRGGIAIPLGDGFSLLKGRSHEQGGIDIDMKGDGRIWSDVPLLNGKSPAKRLIEGEDPNTLFTEQEIVKNTIGLNDDGSKKTSNGQKTEVKIERKPRKINLENIKTTKGRPYDVQNMTRVINSLDTIPYLNDYQKAAIAANILEESGGNPNAVDATGKFKGLLQWSDDRISSPIEGDINTNIDLQLTNDLYKTLNDTKDRKSWNHGGEGSGYMTAQDAYNTFINANDLDTAMHSFTRGYVRPTGKDDSVRNRTKVAEQIYQRIQEAKGIEEKRLGGDINGLIYHLSGNVKQGSRYLPFKGERKKAVLGLTTGDWIKAGTNLAGSLLFFGHNLSSAKNIPEIPKPIYKQASKLNTNYNINPQLNTLSEMEAASYNDINSNTNSSNTALARRQAVKLNSLLSRNELYNTKEQEEQKLINTDKLNRQEVTNANVDLHNAYLDKQYARQLESIRLRDDAINGLINNLAGTVGNMVEASEARKERKKIKDILNNIRKRNGLKIE